MTTWIQYQLNGEKSFGQLSGGWIQPHTGTLFENPQAAGQLVKLAEVEILAPCQPQKFLGLWNNFYARATAEGWDIPPEPLYFSKVSSSYLAHGQSIVRPQNYQGSIFFEAELGVVIAKSCYQIREDQAEEYIFGYTCVNDVTAKEILQRDPSFPQWTRAKGFNSFGVFGPQIVSGIRSHDLVIQALLDGEVKQQYPVSDMIFKPEQLVALLSQYMTLLPGDVIACGTGLGACAMEHGQTIEVNIDGVGRLINTMQG
ncbi:MAG: fumarylacetoacetate hydrolase family protein [Gammaproteobacteria bacterium]|nr:fumarylacetoacetate hydrolase family protein [Gammaproteobacteria bacterium]MBL7000838.1 fumarylacetoacetate hydrolase family protein [Gammaproteobacteria bacterium]